MTAMLPDGCLNMGEFDAAYWGLQKLQPMVAIIANLLEPRRKAFRGASVRQFARRVPKGSRFSNQYHWYLRQLRNTYHGREKLQPMVGEIRITTQRPHATISELFDLSREAEKLAAKIQANFEELAA